MEGDISTGIARSGDKKARLYGTAWFWFVGDEKVRRIVV